MVMRICPLPRAVKSQRSLAIESVNIATEISRQKASTGYETVNNVRLCDPDKTIVCGCMMMHRSLGRTNGQTARLVPRDIALTTLVTVAVALIAAAAFYSRCCGRLFARSKKCYR